MNTVKLLAMYLPQYHEIPENDEFWGKGFTDWVTVKRAVPLFDGHAQPRVPFNENYYDLSKAESIRDQITFAKEYGIYGFGIYHYHFSSEKILLTKPAELILSDPSLDIPFFFAWDNANWKRSWSKFKGNAWSPLMDSQTAGGSKENPILIEYKIGEKPEWKEHFDYLLPYFKDERYIKKDGKPIFIILNYSEKTAEMSEYWNELAKQAGFTGMEIIYKYDHYKVPKEVQSYTYEPAFSGWGQLYQRIGQKLRTKLEVKGLRKYSYDRTWKRILSNARKNRKENNYYGAFVNYDDTPRRGKNGKVFLGASPEKFQQYLSELLRISLVQGKEFVFLNAWNEWGEGAYLEPDMTTGKNYLEAVKRAVDSQQ